MTTPAGVSPASRPRNLPGNGEPQRDERKVSQRALMREAANAARILGLNLTPAEIRLTVSGYQSSSDRDTFSISQWLEIRCFDPTGRTALQRAHACDPDGRSQRSRARLRLAIESPPTKATGDGRLTNN